MPEFSNTVISLFHSVERRTAPDQGGLLTGKDPTAFNTADPLRLWIIQVGIIICTTQLLGLLLRKLRQPRVIAEVLGGILLGPTAFGRIPGFSEHIFPTDSIPYLSLVANIGLCLFLFLVGLEIDTDVIKRNLRLSATVALAGISIPFGLGAALSLPLYRNFIDASEVKYTNFMLFTCVAYSITAFPVLCRILTELKLLDTTVGIVVLSAGVGNDIIGWVLLALSVALANASSGLTALYILLICVGWSIFILIPVRKLFLVIARRTGSVENGPTILFMTLTILLLFGSAFFTDVIGVHAIFGAFLAGLVVPREGGLAIHLTEKLEDMVSIIFLPLYFTLSGLSTDLGLLNTGRIWGFTVAICALAYTGKFGGCTIAARFAGFKWREASTIGSLMSCKGLIELIVLNVGLSAGILTQLVFSMFVLEALLLTFCTTPAVVALYPPELRTRAAATGPNFANVSGDESSRDQEQHLDEDSRDVDGSWRKTFLVVLDKIEHVPGMMALAQLIQPPPPDYSERDPAPGIASTPGGSSSCNADKRPLNTDLNAGIHLEALRLIELEDRTSAVMKSSVADSLIHSDPILGIFRTFGELNGMEVNPSLEIVPYEQMAGSVAERGRRCGAQLVLVPWLPPMLPSSEGHTHGHGEMESVPATPRTPGNAVHENWNPFESLFRTHVHHGGERSASVLHSHFIRGVFAQASTDVALFVDCGPTRAPGGARIAGSRAQTGGRRQQHLYLPFFGGPDDRLALEFVVQICAREGVRATVVRVRKREGGFGDGNNATAGLLHPDAARLADEKVGDIDEAMGSTNVRANQLTIASMTGIPDTVYGNATTQTRLQSETADSVAWAKYTSLTAHETKDPLLSAALSRITFEELSTPIPLHAVTEQVKGLCKAPTMTGENSSVRVDRLLVVLGRSRRLAVENHHKELKELADKYGNVGSEVKKTVGDVATAFVLSGCTVGLVVMQAVSTTAAD